MRTVLLSLILASVLNGCGLKDASSNTNHRWWKEEDRRTVLQNLDRTTDELQGEIDQLSNQQWHFKKDSSTWSISEIVEHLEIQNLLHYRELSVTSQSPQHLQFGSITKGQDDFFKNYSTDPVKSTAKWFLEPRNRYKTVEEGWSAFYKARNELRKFVAATNVDLRKQFTFRTPVEGKEIDRLKIGQVRDLHQLLLTGIAHTDRHLHQIRNIKRDPRF